MFQHFFKCCLDEFYSRPEAHELGWLAVLLAGVVHGLLDGRMSRRKGVMKMINVNELVDLAQQLDSVMDDSDRGVISANFYKGVNFLVRLDYFLAHFNHGDIVERSGTSKEFEVSTEVDGVVFSALVGRDELEKLRGFAPDEWIDRQALRRSKKVLSIKNAQSQGNVTELVKSM